MPLHAAHLRLQTHSENAFPLQQWFYERASLLRYTYNARIFVYRYVLIYFYKVGIFSLASLLLSDYNVAAFDFEINAMCWIH